ncbi:bZIP transcription factor 12-like [Rhodamnia argentea]|uniref:BZIP transcription factor 12-like n=1 Tax=Rhodamnia argentea TaxID=178133 RepID=A0ABM3HG59_9MYRT|nr:bZIP transcription factor 12-like [Rhodamnia argentea]XP_048135577.1 bZIP transcription factor 12-like [Rhodamnia argentea]
MASSKLMTSTTSSRGNPDLPLQSSISSSLSALISDLQDHHHHNNHAIAAAGNAADTSGAVTMDDLLKNIYSDDGPATPDPALFNHGGGGGGGAPLPGAGAGDAGGSKTVDEVWKEIVVGSDGASGRGEEEMTLEDFLTKSGAVREEDVRIGGGGGGGGGAGGYCGDAADDLNGHLIQVGGTVGVGGGGGVSNNNGGFEGRVVVGRGKRRAVEEPVDKATQQKQKRMIKNRESAARSRERKQAYTAELESLVTQLEEEKARLLREEAEQSKERLKQLVKNLVPVVESRRPRRPLRRINSMNW